MLGVLISVGIVYGVFKALPMTRQLDPYTVLAVVVAPALLNFIFGLAMLALAIPTLLGLAALSLYFFVPFLWLPLVLGKSYTHGAIAGAVVLVVTVAVSLVLESVLA